MNDREGVLVGAALALMLVLWLGFFVHRSPRFAGSLGGGLLGVSAALLMLVPVGYSLMKRSRRLRAILERRLSLSRALAWHAYTSLAGAILAILHSGHRFESPVGVVLTAMMLVGVVSGYVGRHLLRYVAQDLRERQQRLGVLQQEYAALALRPDTQAAASLQASPWHILRRAAGRIVAGWPAEDSVPGARARIEALARSMAELEYSIAAEQRIRKWLAVWLTVHLGASIVFYGLLAVHIASGIYYGLRWFD